jgi:hypothetical protein
MLALSSFFTKKCMGQGSSHVVLLLKKETDMMNQIIISIDSTVRVSKSIANACMGTRTI